MSKDAEEGCWVGTLDGVVVLTWVLGKDVRQSHPVGALD